MTIVTFGMISSHPVSGKRRPNLPRVYNPAGMEADDSRQITVLLNAWTEGDPEALDRLIPLVYSNLRRMAGRQMRFEGPNTLQPTALVNEAYLRLAGGDRSWQNRAHFFAVAAKVMRRVLVDAARARTADKRGGGQVKVALNPSVDGLLDRAPELIALDEALDALAALDARKAQVVEMKFFGGLSVEEAADVLRVSPRSVMRDWQFARAWLKHELGADTR
jgi:RNA polymerase sigma factor (TIGR02999 family)